VGRHDRLFRVWGGGGGGQLSRDAPARRSGGVRGRPPAAGRGGGWAGFGPTLLEIAVDAREAILVAARRNNLPIDASKLTVKPEGSGIRVSLRWSYVLLEFAGETALAVPLWLDRTFELRP